jgi:hypothetical protein
MIEPNEEAVCEPPLCTVERLGLDVVKLSTG